MFRSLRTGSGYPAGVRGSGSSKLAAQRAQSAESKGKARTTYNLSPYKRLALCGHNSDVCVMSTGGKQGAREWVAPGNLASGFHGRDGCARRCSLLQIHLECSHDPIIPRAPFSGITRPGVLCRMGTSTLCNLYQNERYPAHLCSSHNLTSKIQSTATPPRQTALRHGSRHGSGE